MLEYTLPYIPRRPTVCFGGVVLLIALSDDGEREPAPTPPILAVASAPPRARGGAGAARRRDVSVPTSHPQALIFW